MTKHRYGETITLTQEERAQVDKLCRKRRARLEIKTPDDTAFSTLKVLDLGDGNTEQASTRAKLRAEWYKWYHMYPEGTQWRIVNDFF